MAGEPGREHCAGDFNNQLVELRPEQLLEGVATPMPDKPVEPKLQLPFGSYLGDS
jgi:hypothetical protein